MRKKYGVTVAGANEPRGGISQLKLPYDFFLNVNLFLCILEYGNCRVTKWNLGTMVGQIVAGRNGVGSRDDQFNNPQVIAVDRERERECLFISDAGNNCMVQWSLQCVKSGKTVVSGVGSVVLTMDE